MEVFVSDINFEWGFWLWGNDFDPDVKDLTEVLIKQQNIDTNDQ